MYQVQYGAPLALDVATVTKLVRNLSMPARFPLIGAEFLPVAVECPGNEHFHGSRPTITAAGHPCRSR
jgi:hypothetical protein